MADVNDIDFILVDPRGIYDESYVPETDREANDMFDESIERILHDLDRDNEYRRSWEELQEDAVEEYLDEPLALTTSELDGNVYVELYGDGVYMTSEGMKLNTLDEAKRWLASNMQSR